MQAMGSFSPVQELHSARKRTVGLFYLFLLFSFLSENAYAASADLQTVLNNLSRIIVPLTAMVLVISYMAGVYMIIHGLSMMKKLGNISTAYQAQPGELGGPLVSIFVGAVLIYLPSSTDTFMESIFGTTASIFGFGSDINYANLGQGASLLGYVGGDTFQQQWASLANTLVLYIQFIGLLSFIKGWFIISKAAAPGQQPGVMAKGITHIVGGIVAMNFVGAVNIISNTIYGT